MLFWVGGASLTAWVRPSSMHELAVASRDGGLSDGFALVRDERR